MISSHTSTHALTSWLWSNKTTLQQLALSWEPQPHEWVSASCKELVDAISNCNQLQSLNLSHLDIGSNTKSLSALTNLTSLNFCNCGIAGAKVQELSCLRQLQNLQNLQFQLDEDTYGVPMSVYDPEKVLKQISGLTQLTSLSLFSSNIYLLSEPFLSSLLPLSQLKDIRIRNLLIMPEDYHFLHKLPLVGASLRVQEGGQAMEQLSSWIQQHAASQLQELDIRSPSDEEPLPGPQSALLLGELAVCSQLQVLHLSNYDLTEASAQIGNLTQLTHLRLGQCSISAGVASQVGTLSNLSKLRLDSMTGFEDPADVIALLEGLTLLTSLVVAGRLFHRDDIHVLSKLERLQELHLPHTPAFLLDRFLTGLAGLTSLHMCPLVTAYDCASEQTAAIGIIAHLTKLRDLVLVLADPDMTGICAMDLARLSQLTFLQVGEHKLKATHSVSRGVLMGTRKWEGLKLWI